MPPPWESRFADDGKAQDGKEFQASPISAGVDGTQSASGVIGHLDEATNEDTTQEKMELFRERLIPRCPTVADVSSSETNEPPNWYSVTLDGRTLRTPIGQVLAVPSRILAWGIAAEWNAQTTQIKPVQMPLMTLTCTTLDQTASNPEHYQNTALKFLPTDTTCYWADEVEDRVLHRHQATAWKELHDFIEKELEETPAVAMGAQEGILMSKRNRDTGAIGLPHPSSLQDACIEWTRRLDAWHLTALNAVASETKSFLVAFALLHPSSPFSSKDDDDSIAKAIRAARVEEEFQIESWGLVEGQHDYDRLNCAVQIRSAKLFSDSVLQQSKA